MTTGPQVFGFKRTELLVSRLIVIAVLAAGCVACSGAGGRGAGLYFGAGRPGGLNEIARREKPLIGFEAAVPQRWSLANGLTVMFLEDDELPLVSGTLFVRGGSLWEEEGKTGVAAAMGDLMRRGGAGRWSADELDRELEILAARVSSVFGAEFGSISFSCLESDFEQVFGLFASVVLAPRFEDRPLTIWKGQNLEAIRRRVDSPETIAGLAMRQLLYGASPYGQVMVSADVDSISRADLIQAHRRFVRPNGAILAVSGKLARGRLEGQIERRLGQWKAAKDERPLAPPVADEPRPGIYFIEQPFEQSTVFAGHLGVERLSPDHLAIEVFNEIFGAGGFSSRLFKQVRTKEGLAYAVYGAIIPGVVRGRNLIVVQTKAQSTSQALLSALNVLSELQQEEVEEAELEEVKRSIRNSFVFNFDTPAKILTRRSQFELLGYPDDYDYTYLPGIEAVRPAAVREVARRRWNLNGMIAVIVGNKDAYAQVLEMVNSQPTWPPARVLKQVDFKEQLKDIDG